MADVLKDVLECSDVVLWNEDTSENGWLEVLLLVVVVFKEGNSV